MHSSKKTSSAKRRRSVSRSPSPRESSSSSIGWVESSKKKRSATGDGHSQRTQRSIPAFLNKLYSMVDDSSTDELIRWSKGGNSFIVEQQELFSKTVLPRFYKHNTFSSFVRQLNMYDFHKVPHLQQGVLVTDSEHELWEFSHPNFQRDRYELLHMVVRKRIRTNNDQQTHLSQQPHSQAQLQQQLQQQQQHSQRSSPMTTPTLHHLSQNPPLPLLEQALVSSPGESSVSVPGARLNALGDTSLELEHVRLGSLVKDISTIRQHQHAISADLQHLHNDNEILWRETLLAREKHQKHQQVIERILLFLTSVFSNDGFSGGSGAGAAAAAAAIGSKKSQFMLGKTSELLGEGAGHLDSAVTPNLLIEEAVKLAGISTTSLQKKFFEHGGLDGGSSKMEDANSPVGQQQRQPSTSSQQQQRSDQDQEKGKFAMKSYDPNRCEQQQQTTSASPSPFSPTTTNPRAHYQPRDQQPSPRHSRQLPTHQNQQEHPLLHHLHHSQTHLHPQHPHLQHPYHLRSDQQSRMGHLPTGGGMSPYNNTSTSSNSDDTKLNMERTPMTLQSGPATPGASSVTSSAAGTPTHAPTNNPLHSLHSLQAFSALTGMVGDMGGGGGGGGGDITRIVGLAESLHTATRSAEAISQDIDDLQISIESLAATMGLDANVAEGFDGYLDEFTDNYSNMISMATRNDKMQLFELAGNDSNTQDEQSQTHPQHQHQPHNHHNQHHHHQHQHHHNHHHQSPIQPTGGVSPVMNRDYNTMPPSSDGA